MESNSDNSLELMKNIQFLMKKYSVPNSNRRWSLKFKLIFFYQQSRWHCGVIGDKKKLLFNKLLSKGIFYNCSAPEVSGIASLAVKGYNDANTKSSVETEVLF